MTLTRKSLFFIGSSVLLSAAVLVTLYGEYLLIPAYTALEALVLLLYPEYVSSPLWCKAAVLAGVALVVLYLFITVSLQIGRSLSKGTRGFLGRILEKTLGVIPGYSSLQKILLDVMSGGGMKKFTRFGVAYPYGRENGVGTPVIVTGESENAFSVMCPSAPTPMTGFIYYYPKESVDILDITGSEFLEHIVSLGSTNSDSILAYLEK